MRALVIPPKIEKEELLLVQEEGGTRKEEEARLPPPKLLRYAPLSIVVEKGENLVAKDWSFRKAQSDE